MNPPYRMELDCPHCGQLTVRGNFCSGCGRPLIQGQAPPTAELRAQGAPVKIVAGDSSAINVTTTPSPRRVPCDFCGGLREEAQLFVCRRCQKTVCTSHKSAAHLVCGECAESIERERRHPAQDLCGFPGCAKPVAPSSAFACRRCGRRGCSSHCDSEYADRCRSCAEALRREEFDRRALNAPLEGADASAAQALFGVAQAEPPFRARIWTQRGPQITTRDIQTVPRNSRGGFRIGDAFTLNAQTDRDCYLTILDWGTSGNLYLLLRNHRLRAGSPLQLRGPDTDHVWHIGPPDGIERLKAFFTPSPVALFHDAQPFSPLASAGAMRDIVTRTREVASAIEQMPADSWTDDACAFTVEP